MICQVDGTVNSGHCTCMAGLGEVCSDVAAVLFYLESASRSKLTCTQVGCTWKEPTMIDAIPYLPIAQLPLSKPKPRISCNRKRGAHHLSSITPLTDLLQVAEELPVSEQPSTSKLDLQPQNSLLCAPPSDEEKIEFLKDIVQHQSVICSIVPPFSEQFNWKYAMNCSYALHHRKPIRLKPIPENKPRIQPGIHREQEGLPHQK